MPTPPRVVGLERIGRGLPFGEHKNLLRRNQLVVDACKRRFIDVSGRGRFSERRSVFDVPEEVGIGVNGRLYHGIGSLSSCGFSLGRDQNRGGWDVVFKSHMITEC